MHFNSTLLLRESAHLYCAAEHKCTEKKDMIFVDLISQANGKFKLHTVKALHPKLS